MDGAGPSREIPFFKTKVPEEDMEQGGMGEYAFRRWSTRERKPVARYSELLTLPPDLPSGKPKGKSRKRKVQPSGKDETSSQASTPFKKKRINPNYQVPSGSSESDSPCYETFPPESKSVIFKRRKRVWEVHRSGLTIIENPQCDAKTLDSIKQIFQAAGSQKVSDLMVPSHLHGSLVKLIKKDARDQAVQQFMQGMLERRFPPVTEREKLLNIRVMAEAARTLGCVRCDGWCYNWLAEWSLAEGCQQVRMVEITSETKDHEHNHYVLLVPCKPGQALHSGWDDGQQKKLFKKGKLDVAMFSGLGGDGFWLIDPALNQVIPFNEPYFSNYIETYCSAYGRALPAQLSIRTVYDLDKQGVGLSPQDIAQMRQRALYLLPFAIVFQSEYDFKVNHHQYPRIFNHFGFTPYDACPDLFREKAAWNIGTIFCLFSQDAQYKHTLPEGRPCNLDILKCYRTESKEYFNALQEEMTKMLKRGFLLADCLSFLGPKGKTPHYCKIPCDVPIPNHIYQANREQYNLKDPFDWQGLGEAAFELMGIDYKSIQPNFAELVLRMYKRHEECPPDRLCDSILSFFSQGMDTAKSQYQYRQDMVFNRPELKDSICSPPRKISNHLIKHCFHQDREQMAEALKPLVDSWVPTHTLHVCKADSAPYNEAMSVFLQDCVHDLMGPEQIVSALTQKIPGTFPAEKLNIELPEGLRVQSLKGWNVESVNALMALYKGKGWVKETTREYQLNFLKDKIKNLYPMKDNVTSQSGLVQYLARHTHFAERVVYCYPRLSAEKVRNRMASCMRFLVKEFDSPLATVPATRNNIFALQEYDETVLLQDVARGDQTSLRTAVETTLAAGHNLSFVARRKFCEGRGKEKAMAVTNLYRKEPTCDWSFADMLRLMRAEDETSEDCMKRLFEQYGARNESLRMEYGVYLAKGDVSQYDGLMVDYVHGLGKSTPPSRQIKGFYLLCRT